MGLIFNKDTGKFDIKVINAKGEKFEFSIPSKTFPLDNNENYDFFTSQTTKPIVMNQKLLKIINSIPTEMGRCYTNTTRLCDEAKKQGIELEFYAGWVIFPDLLPVHHAWAVYNKDRVIDLTNEKNAEELFKNIDFSKKDYRKDVAKIYKELYEKPNTKRCIIGKVNKSNIYIGSKSTKRSARIIFNQIANNKTHILHKLQSSGTSLEGMSKLQEEFYSLEE